MRLTLAIICLLGLLAGAETNFGQARRRATKGQPRPVQKLKRTQKTQERVPPMPILPDLRSDPDFQNADVAIIANVTAKELKFETVANPTVEFLSKDKTQTIWHADRYNLPDKIEPGVTYRNVGIRLKITSRLADIDRIVAEALGEIPINDEAPSEDTSAVGNSVPAVPKQKDTATRHSRVPAPQKVPHD